jgi:hypothetical protein
VRAASTNPSSRQRRRVLLGQLISNGDCLYATTVARQIKHDDPDCHLTWAVSTRCKSVLEANPHVDAIWEWPAFANEEAAAVWGDFERQAHTRQAAGEFDAIYLTQFTGDNMFRWRGTLRGTIYEGYPHPITVPIAPVVCLSAVEVENVRRFAQRHGLLRTDAPASRSGPPVILFECAPGSRQSPVTPAFALEVSRRLLRRHPNLRVVLSSNLPVDVQEGRILDGSELTFRENAELSYYCSLLLGCSSGLSWLCTSEAARRLPTVQVLSSDTFNSNPLSVDHAHWGLPTEHIIEMFDASPELTVDCVERVFQEGFAGARARFHQRQPRQFQPYRALWRASFCDRNYPTAARLLWRNKAVLLDPVMWYWHVGVMCKWLLLSCPRSASETPGAFSPRHRR